MKKEDPNEEIAISMRMPRWLRDQFQVYAKTQQRSLSSQLRQMMIETLEEWNKQGGAQVDAFNGTTGTKTVQKRRIKK